MTDDATGSMEFSCPRCGSTVNDQFWGPCERCRGDLRRRVTGVAHDVEVTAYEPKMNVTPNAVATKD